MDKRGIRKLIGVFIGAIIAAFITSFTPPIVWIFIIVILSLSFIIDWDKLSKDKNERLTNMNKETIEKAADKFATAYTGVSKKFRSKSLDDAFSQGAKWRIGSVWHDMREKPEREDEYLLVEYRDLGVDRSDYEVIASENFERCCRRRSTTFIRWAYINDLLPDVTKETDQENCCGNCRHFMNEDINGDGWCSEIDDETTCGETCERWKDIP